MNERLVDRVKALVIATHTAQNRSDPEMVAALYAAVTELNRLMDEARQSEIEVTLDVSYNRILDAHRPHVAMVQLKVAKLLHDA